MEVNCIGLQRSKVFHQGQRRLVLAEPEEEGAEEPVFINSAADPVDCGI